MASITQNKKDGKVISYKFKACIGRDEFGKQIFRCTTWKAPDGLSAARIEKAAQKAAAEWEQQAKRGIQARCRKSRKSQRKRNRKSKNRVLRLYSASMVSDLYL